ncbi:hypothetical protein BD749_0452 [Pontibacter ramchanderi]|uniref:Uncharacterized protein n=1 Tax=Pontibacter ramchanderi TaxID=1179743 RepID=A0A2N3V1K6_9BACT|nr:hypothetical protein BD749_0452 [Pontibacter ramchanderi]
MQFHYTYLLNLMLRADLKYDRVETEKSPVKTGVQQECQLMEVLVHCLLLEQPMG